MKANLKLTAVYEEAEEGGYIAFFEELPGVNTQGETFEEAKKNLLEALDLVMDTQRMLSEKNIGEKNVIRESFVFAS
jgi:predicted RNase H-like HicB family nuclease